VNTKIINCKKNSLKLQISSFFYAIKNAVPFIKRHQLSWFFAIPIFMNFLLLMITAWIGFKFSSSITDTFFDYIESLLNDEFSDSFWYKTTFVFVNIAIRLAFLFLYFSVFKYIILVLLSPALAIMAEKINDKLNPLSKSHTYLIILKNTFRGVFISIYNFLKESILSLFLIVLTFFIPIFAPITAPAIIIIHIYYFGYSIVDYYVELNNLELNQRIKTIRKTRVFNFLIGLSFYLMFLIPFVGWVLAPIVCIVLAGIGLNYYNKNQIID
jgi:CysZ protein